MAAQAPRDAGKAGHTVLVTGAAGHVGGVVVAALAEAGHRVHTLDRRAYAGPVSIERETLGDIAEASAWQQAYADDGAAIESVIHLAANPFSHADFLDDLIEPNIRGVYHALRSAADRQVRRFILASTVQTVAGRGPSSRPPRPLSADMQAPNNFYGVTKCFAEHAAWVFVQNRELASVVVARIGWFVRDPDEFHALVRYAERDRGTRSVYVSPRDLGHFFVAAVEAEHAGFDRYWCTGPDMTDGTTPRYDLAPAARDLGYVPRDRFPVGLPEGWLIEAGLKVSPEPQAAESESRRNG
jgi:nucleoside-diphosphate-sugar epimerase